VSALSSQKKSDVLSMLQRGCTIREVSRSLHVGVGTVQRLRQKCVFNVESSHGGRPRKMTPAMERSCVLNMTRGKLSTAVEATKNVQEAFGMQVCVETVRRVLRRGGLQSQVKQKKPRLSVKNIKARLDFARAHLDWTIDDWSRVIFFDESKINLFCSDGISWCWSRDPHELSTRTVTETVKHGGGGIMIWGSMTIYGPGLVYKVEGRLNQHGYRQILEQTIDGTIRKYGLDATQVIFQQDNASVHTTKMMQEWFSRQSFSLLTWPAQSPDLNPIEHLWAILKRRLNQYDSPPKGMIELWERVVQVFSSITAHDCRRLIESMPKRIEAVIASKGRWTKY
jgi:transposase